MELAYPYGYKCICVVSSLIEGEGEFFIECNFITDPVDFTSGLNAETQSDYVHSYAM